MTDLTVAKMMIKRGGEEIEVSIDGYIDYETDTRYGEDAEGRRAIGRTFINEVSDIQAVDDFSGKPIALTINEVEQAGDILINMFLNG